MKYISKFSEAAPLRATLSDGSKMVTSKSYIEPVKSAFVDIRNILVDFEDMNIIRYHSPGSDLKFDPSGGDPLNHSTDDVSYYIPYIVLTSRFSSESIKLNCYIDMSCNADGGYDDIDMLEDVIVCIKRLNSSGYKSSLNFSSNYSSTRSVIISILISL